MSQPRFDELRERLLRAGIAPRHVRRTIGELRDHFDDLVREELADGASRTTAESTAQRRLGSDDDIVSEILKRPGLRSLTARYPWAVFGLGPIALLIAAFAATLIVELQAFRIVGQIYKNPSHHVPELMISVVAAWNALPTLIAPLVIAAVLYVVGSRQRISRSWLIAGVTIACVLGAFQKLTWTDNGYHGELMLGSGILPPFHRDLFLDGIVRAGINLAIMAVAWWWLTRRKRQTIGALAAAE
ncbi:MAG: hypothetical protein ABSD74_19900 [Rhizomicrobium sp.]|jgi:hypothetical protein